MLVSFLSVFWEGFSQKALYHGGFDGFIQRSRTLGVVG